MPEKKIKIVNVVDVPALEPDRIGKYDVLVTYQIDTEHTYTIKIPKEELEKLPPDEQERYIIEKVREDAKWRMRWLGKEISL